MYGNVPCPSSATSSVALEYCWAPLIEAAWIVNGVIIIYNCDSYYDTDYDNDYYNDDYVYYITLDLYGAIHYESLCR